MMPQDPDPKPPPPDPDPQWPSPPNPEPDDPDPDVIDPGIDPQPLEAGARLSQPKLVTSGSSANGGPIGLGAICALRAASSRVVDVSLRR